MHDRLLHRRRLACDRCHSQKLRCPRPSGADVCERCRRANAPCVFSMSTRGYRAPAAGVPVGFTPGSSRSNSGAGVGGSEKTPSELLLPHSGGVDMDVDGLLDFPTDGAAFDGIDWLEFDNGAVFDAPLLGPDGAEAAISNGILDPALTTNDPSIQTPPRSEISVETYSISSDLVRQLAELCVELADHLGTIPIATPELFRAVEALSPSPADDSSTTSITTPSKPPPRALPPIRYTLDATYTLSQRLLDASPAAVAALIKPRLPSSATLIDLPLLHLLLSVHHRACDVFAAIFRNMALRIASQPGGVTCAHSAAAAGAPYPALRVGSFVVGPAASAEMNTALVVQIVERLWGEARALVGLIEGQARNGKSDEEEGGEEDWEAGMALGPCRALLRRLGALVDEILRLQKMTRERASRQAAAAEG